MTGGWMKCIVIHEPWRLATLLSLFLLLAVGPVQRELKAQGDLMLAPDRLGLSATYTDRLGDGGSREILTEVAPGTLSGVGDLGGGCHVFGTTLVTADEDAATPEVYRIVIRAAVHRVLGPMPDVATELFRSGPFTTPPGGPGRAAWIIRTSFAAPVNVSCTQGFYHGIEVTPAPAWPRDGQGVFAAYYQPPAGSNGLGDNPRSGVPSLGWTVQAGIAARAASACSLYLGVFTLGPALSLGGIDPANTRQVPPGAPCYGAGGMFPDVWNHRRDGLEARVSDLRLSGGTALLLLGVRLAPVPIALPGLGARLWLDPALPLQVLGSAPLALGDAIVPIAPAGTIPVFVATGTVVFQAVVVGPSMEQAAFSNAVAVRF